MVLGDAFIRACRPGYESGLVMISSASAKFAMQGMAVYGAAKAGMEQWVRAVRAERKTRRADPWVVAIRPGFIVTEQMRAQYAHGHGDLDAFPGGAAVAKPSPRAGRVPRRGRPAIWRLLPPDPNGRTVLFLGEFIEGRRAEIKERTGMTDDDASDTPATAHGVADVAPSTVARAIVIMRSAV